MSSPRFYPQCLTPITIAQRCAKLAALVGGIAALAGAASPAAGQAAYHACYVPSVGALYLIKIPGLPTRSLAAAHIEIGWNDAGTPGPTGPPGPQGVAGPKGDPSPRSPGVSGYEIVRSAVATVPAGVTNELFATCPAGKAVLAGEYWSAYHCLRSLVVPTNWCVARRGARWTHRGNDHAHLRRLRSGPVIVL